MAFRTASRRRSVSSGLYWSSRSGRELVMRSRYLKRHKLTMEDNDRIIREIDAQTNDRALVLVAGGMLEDFLGGMIQLKLEVMKGGWFIDDDINDLYDSYGPFSTFDLKIRFAGSIGMLTPEYRKDIERIKSIRNYFAHETSPVSFSDKDVIQECENLQIWRATRADIPDRDSPKERFKMSVKILMAMIVVACTDDLIKAAKMGADSSVPPSSSNKSP